MHSLNSPDISVFSPEINSFFLYQELQIQVVFEYIFPYYFDCYWAFNCCFNQLNGDFEDARKISSSKSPKSLVYTDLYINRLYIIS